MDEASAVLHLMIDVGSDPITGSVAGESGEPRRFTGWMDLAEAIERARRDPIRRGWSAPGAAASAGASASEAPSSNGGEA